MLNFTNFYVLQFKIMYLSKQMYMFDLFKGVVQDYNTAGFTRLFFEAELEAESKLKSSAQKISSHSYFSTLKISAQKPRPIAV